MPVQVKICGLSTPETVDAAIAGGASHVGFVFYPMSPRNISLDRAAALAARVPGHVRKVGIFVDPLRDLVEQVVDGAELDVVQLHGDETPAFAANIGVEVWKAISVKSASDLAAAASYSSAATRIIYDAKAPVGTSLPGGRGLRFDWELLRSFAHPLPWVLSGGLDASNLVQAIAVTGAPFVDVSSGVESAPGVKNVDKIAAFLKAARAL